jgi:uncharacterized protein YndB with AHSA1/START domain
MDMHHETLVFERNFNVPPARLFQSYADPREREIWSAPSPETVIIIDQTDVRTGGQELGRCGSAKDLSWTMKVAYHLVKQDELITFTEELWEGDAILTIALITFEIEQHGKAGSRLKLTDQITSFVGKGGVAGHLEGYTLALDNLVARLNLS